MDGAVRRRVGRNMEKVGGPVFGVGASGFFPWLVLVLPAALGGNYEAARADQPLWLDALDVWIWGWVVFGPVGLGLMMGGQWLTKSGEGAESA